MYHITWHHESFNNALQTALSSKVLLICESPVHYVITIVFCVLCLWPVFSLLTSTLLLVFQYIFPAVISILMIFVIITYYKSVYACHVMAAFIL